MSNLYMRQDLTASEQMAVDSELNKNKKDKVVMILLWLFLAGMGAHRFYLKDTGYAIAMLLFGWMTLLIWPLVDIFFALKRLEQYNEKVEEQAILKIKGSRSNYGERSNPLKGQVTGSSNDMDYAGPGEYKKMSAEEFSKDE